MENKIDILAKKAEKPVKKHTKKQKLCYMHKEFATSSANITLVEIWIFCCDSAAEYMLYTGLTRRKRKAAVSRQPAAVPAPAPPPLHPPAPLLQAVRISLLLWASNFFAAHRAHTSPDTGSLRERDDVCAFFALQGDESADFPNATKNNSKNWMQILK